MNVPSRICFLSVSIVLCCSSACRTRLEPNPSDPAGASTEPVASREPDLVEPPEFSKWESAYDQPIRVSPEAAMVCMNVGVKTSLPFTYKPVEQGPHADHTVVVRVSPEAITAFREGKPLPTDAVVVKEKYGNALATGPLKEYAVMVKREAGYDPGKGDWEYAFVKQGAERKVTRGRLTECAGCHASVKDRDYLFRSYGGYGR